MLTSRSRKNTVHSSAIQLKVENILVTLFLLFFLLSFITEMPIWKIRYAFPIILIIYQTIKKHTFIIKSKFIKMFAVWFFLGACPTMMHNHNIDFLIIFIQTGYMIIAYYLMENPESYTLVKAVISLYHIYNLYLLLFNRMELANNYVSVMYIILLTIVYLQTNRKNTEVPFLHSVIALLFSVFSESRGGMISLLVLNIVIAFKTKSKYRKVLLVFLFSVIPLLFIIGQLYRADVFSHFNVNGLSSNGRFYIWSSYLARCGTGFKNFIFGVNFQEYLDSYQYYRPPHIHSSFLAYYGNYGLLVFVMTVWILLVGFKRYLKNKDIYTIAIMLCFMVRSFTDIVFGGYYGDIAFYAFIYCIVTYKTDDKAKLGISNEWTNLNGNIA